jgi:hypothetical protein
MASDLDDWSAKTCNSISYTTARETEMNGIYAIDSKELGKNTNMKVKIHS